MKPVTIVEVSYEVANKVGGIYTVLVSKIAQAVSSAGDYYAIGPYSESSASSEFMEETPPAALGNLFARLEKKHGFRCHYGKWKIEKEPKTILVDFSTVLSKANDIKHHLWEEYKIDSWKADDWFNEPVVWAECTGILIEEMLNSGFLRGDVVAHFHEWLAGAALLHLKSSGSRARTVFTTHSTVLGRTIAETGSEDLYALINAGRVKKQPVPDEKVYQYRVQAKHLMEKATALNADVFTTVSEIMADECKFMLGRRPEVVLNNGLDMRKFPRPDEVFSMHEKHTKEIKNFLTGYFLPYYDVDFDDSLVVFLSGRHEFRNKGIDIFIDALGRLNSELKASGAKTPMVAFIFVPFGTGGKKPTVVEHLRVFEMARKIIDSSAVKVEKDMLRLFVRGRINEIPEAINRDVLQKLKNLGESLLKMEKDNPPLSPFQVAENNITQAMISNGLLNREEDVVKVIYYPSYVAEKDGLLDMKYYSAMSGCDMGVFPSYYESWGYTPLEAAALGLQAVTTDLSGFGKFIQPKLKPGEMSIMVMRRDRVDDKKAVAELSGIFLDVYRMSEEERTAERKRAKQLSALADWEHLFENYKRAYEMAMKAKK